MIRSHTGCCIVFDLDDTLYDEIEFVRSGFQAVADAVWARFGVDCRGLLRERVQTRRLEGAFQAAVLAGLPAVALDFMLETYRTHRPSIKPRDGVAALLAFLKDRDGVVGCITDGRGVTQRAKVAALGLEGVLDPLLISEETGHAKPDPYNFREMARLVQAHTFWYVADNPLKDFVGPNALGWTTVGIDAPRGIRQHGRAMLAPPHLPRHQLALAEALALLSQLPLGF